MKRRFTLLVVCLAAGAATGALGALATGSEWWYIAIPIALAAGWLRVGTPERCDDAGRRLRS